MPQALTGGAQTLNSGSSLASPPAQSANNSQIAAMSNLKEAAPDNSQCTAWVNFDGTTGAIISSFNVASVTRTAAGVYVISPTVPWANTNYTFSGSVKSGVAHTNFIVGQKSDSLQTTTQLGVVVTNGGSTTNADVPVVRVQVFGGKY